MRFNKFFTGTVLASEIDWDDRAAVLRLWHDRIDGWYFVPIEGWPVTGHEAFVALLAVNAAIRANARYILGDDSESGWLALLYEADEAFAQDDGNGESVGSRYVAAMLAVHGGERLRDTEGISGHGLVAKILGERVVFDPWVVRDQVRSWFAAKCEELISDPGSYEAAVVCDRIRADFEVVE